MPCDTVQRSTVDLGRVGDRALLVKALALLGYSNARLVGSTIYFGVEGVNGGTILATGKMQLWGAATALNEYRVKEAYGNAAVQAAADTFGWEVTKTDVGKYELVKTSF